MGNRRAKPLRGAHRGAFTITQFALFLGIGAVAVELGRGILAFAAPRVSHSSFNTIAILAGALLAGYALAWIRSSLVGVLEQWGLFTPSCGAMSCPADESSPLGWRPVVRPALLAEHVPCSPRAPPWRSIV